MKDFTNLFSIATRTVTVSKPTFKKAKGKAMTIIPPSALGSPLGGGGGGGIYTDALCDGSLDTIVSTSQGQTYAFYGSKYWKLTDTDIAPGYPR